MNIWSKALHEFKKEIPEHFFEPFIKPLKPLQEAPIDGVFVLGVPDERIFCYLEKRTIQQLETTLKSLMGRDVTIQLKPIREETHFNPVSLSGSQKRVDSSRITKELTFDNFIRLESNRLAVSVLERSSQEPTGAGLILLNGESGCGKTHLLHAYADLLKKNSPRSKINLLNLESFKTLFDRLSGTERKSAIKMAFADGDIFLIDDLNSICDSGRAAEDILLYLLNIHIEKNSNVIITTERPLSEIRLSRRFLDRLISGIQIQIFPAELVGRSRFLDSILIKERVSPPPGLIEYITPRLKPNFHLIESLGNTLVFLIRNGYDLNDVEFFEKNLSSFLVSNSDTVVSMKDIVNAVSDSFGIPSELIHGNSRRSEITLPRHVAMYLGIKLARLNKSAVARFFSKKDHTTVINAERKIGRLMKNDPVLRSRIELIQNTVWKKRE